MPMPIFTGYRLPDLDFLPSMVPGAALIWRIICLPKNIGKHPESNDLIKADIGRYGPYLRCGGKTSSVITPDSILDLSLERAIEILSANKKKSGAQVIKELKLSMVSKKE